MERLTVYHGGPRLISKAKGYIASRKKGRAEYGVGLYTSVDYDHARRYGRAVSEIEIEVNPQNEANSVMVPFHEVLTRYGWFASDAACKRIQAAFTRCYGGRGYTSISLGQLFPLIYNNDPLHHKHMQEINNIFLGYGCTHTKERNYNDMIIIHDFTIIKTIKKAFT